MKIRLRFSKQGQMKFIGHLDMVRYFQRVMRRAGVDITYSEGFSPHQKMSFAAPLSVGLTSRGEYFDIEVNSTQSTKEMLRNINLANVEGIHVCSYKLLPEGAKNAMSIVAGADYLVHTELFTADDIKQFHNREHITVIKKTKKSEKETDIRPFIYEMYKCDEGIFLKVAQGSAQNLKPELVMKAMADYFHIELPSYILYERLDLYCLKENSLVSLDDIGDNIE